MESTINIKFEEAEIYVDDFENPAWKKAEIIELVKLWSGADAVPEHHAAARLLWTENALLVRFDCRQHEPFVANPTPQTDKKADKLWERDVCEIFVAPNREEPERYFEFEFAPTGEWLDLAIHQMPEKRETDWNYNSGMKTATKIWENSFVSILRVEWRAFGKKPEENEIWRGNLFRCVGKDETTRYITWIPTLTEKPNFHVPQRFGWFKFIKF